MARFSHYLAAGVGVLVAFFLLCGFPTVALADPGGPHSDRGSSSDRGNGGGKGRGGSERNDHDRRGNGNHENRGPRRPGDASNNRRDDRGSVSSGKPDSGKGGNGNDTAEPGIIESPQARVGSGRVAATDTEDSAPSLAATSDVSDVSTSRVSESATTVTVEAISPGGSGSGLAGTPSPQFSPPRVTVGNGREPWTQSRQPGPQAPVPASQWQAPAVPLAPPPPPPTVSPAPPASPMTESSAPRVLTQQLGGVGATTDWSNPLWGLAGLLLIPAAGAALGYRQACAAHAAERLRLRRA
ncbi:hypothetical protein AB4Z42_06640 [Mycobacterium sp. 2YAF39]|uniref:hypothetical protein n=1 Tax=Mycobacterium sp. 2YAF39 TaxID=3233033 RepID=UPI003F9E8C37